MPTHPRLPTTGPALFFVQTPDLSGPAYFGTCQAKPTIEEQDIFTPVYNDLGGTAPFDMQFQGKLAVASGVFNRYDNLLALRLSQAPRYNAVLTPVGTQQPLGTNTNPEQGALTVQGNWSFKLWIYFPYYLQAENVVMGMPIGYYFPTCLTVKDEKVVGSSVGEQAYAFQAMRKYQGGVSQFQTYSCLTADFTNLPLDANTLV